MAACSMGSFGAYKMAYSRHKAEMEATEKEIERRQLQQGGQQPQETVWVIKRYVPNDLRVTAPVPRHKSVAPNARGLPVEDENWIPPGDIPLKYFIRDSEEKETYRSMPSSRCESWSTLRQILPSRGRAERSRPPNWGTGFALPPQMSSRDQKKFLHINSPMTRYADDMHTTNRLFRLY